MNRLLRTIQSYNARRELKKYIPQLAHDSQDLNFKELIELIYGDKWQRFFWIKQVESEILALCQLVHEHNPKIILEIGTASGGSLFLFSKLASPNAHLISLDLPEGLYGGGYPIFKSDFYKSFAAKNQKIDLIRDDSHTYETLQGVKNLLAGNEIDLLFIDGDHTYDGVKADFNLYSPLVKSGGIIAFHDIAEHPKEWNVGVKKFWDQLKCEYICKEFIDDPNQGWAGIGVIYK